MWNKSILLLVLFYGSSYLNLCAQDSDDSCFEQSLWSNLGLKGEKIGADDLDSFLAKLIIRLRRENRCYSNQFSLPELEELLVSDPLLRYRVERFLHLELQRMEREKRGASEFAISSVTISLIGTLLLCGWNRSSGFKAMGAAFGAGIMFLLAYYFYGLYVSLIAKVDDKTSFTKAEEIIECVHILLERGILISETL